MTMQISLLEPIGISESLVGEFGKKVEVLGHQFRYYNTKTTDIKELIERSKDQEIVMIANNPYPNEVVRASKTLRMIAVAFTGIDHVGLAACKEQGVEVCNCAGYSDRAVSELVIGLTLSLLRKIGDGDIAVRSGRTSAGLMGSEIGDKTVGIIGCGRIGYQTARLFQAFGAKVLAYSRTVNKEHEKNGIVYPGLETLLSESDIVSLHLPNTSQTKGFLNKERLSLMKQDAIFINCARGPIVDSVALAELLNAGKLAAAGLDVFDTEPPLATDYPLVQAKRTLLTPHVAFLTKEAMVRRSVIEFDNVLSYLKGEIKNRCTF